MSCSDVYFAISGNDGLCVKDLGTDIGDIYNYYDKDMSRVIQDASLVLSSKLVFNNYGEGYPVKSSFVLQIVLCEVMMKDEFLPTMLAIVGYHHSGDPTDLEVVCEVGRILKELGYDIHNF